MSQPTPLYTESLSGRLGVRSVQTREKTSLMTACGTLTANTSVVIVSTLIGFMYK